MSPAHQWLTSAEVGADNRVVREIRVVAQTVGEGPSNFSNNHWSIFLPLEDATERFDQYETDGSEPGIHTIEAVRINMSQIGSNPVPELNWYELMYNVSRSQVNCQYFTPSRGLRVRDIAESIYSRNRQNYVFTPDGCGCRSWVLRIIEDLCEDGYIMEGNAAIQVRDAMRFRYDLNQAPMPLGWNPGYFPDEQ